MQPIVNQLIYFGFFQGIFLLAIFLISPQGRKQANGYLLVLILVLLLGLAGKILNMSELFGTSHRFAALSEFSIFLFGSTIFLFAQSSLKGRRFSANDLIHYVPGLTYILVLIFYYMLPSQAQIVKKIASGELFVAVTIFMGVGLLFNISYWILAYRTFTDFKSQLKNEVSFAVKTSFFKHFLLAIGVCLLMWLSIYFIGLFGQTWLEREARPFIWLGVAFIILFITFYTIRSPELFRVASMISDKEKYAQSKLSRADLNQLKAQLDLFMQEKKPHLNRNLMKADLAKMLGVNNSEVARLLNECIGMNFFEYVNYHRIREFVELAKTKKAEQLTFFGLAQEAGFNSKTTFNKSFKKLMGKSPKEYFSNQ